MKNEKGIISCSLRVDRLLSYQRFSRSVFVMMCLILLNFVSACDGATSKSSDTIEKSRVWAEGVAKDVVSKITKEHPRIYITSERMPELRNEALSSKKHMIKVMQQKMKGPQAAFFYALGNVELLGLPKSRHEYGRIAAEALMRQIRENDRRTSPDSLAILYDWAFDALSDEEKRTFVNFCKMRISQKIPIHDGKLHGYRSSPGPQGIIAALAFFGDGIDDTYARELLIQGIRDTLLDNLAMEHEASSEGGYADGTFYIIQLGGTFYPFLALSIATNSDFFFEHEVLTKLPTYLNRAMLPFPIGYVGKQGESFYFATFHDNWTFTPGGYGSSGKKLADYIAITASEYRRKGEAQKAGLYTWFLNQVFKKIPRDNSDPREFIFMDRGIQPKSPHDLRLPLAEALGWDEEKGEIDHDRFGKKAGIGWVSMQSAWDDPDATFAIFKAEPFFYHGHMHRDSLAFLIAKGEELAIARAGNYMCWYEGGTLKSENPGWPQRENFFSRTISTNNLLVFDPAEDFNGWSNDGGQRIIPYWDKEWGRTYNGTADGNYRDIGGLVRFERTDQYIYSAADATRAYNSTLVTSGKNKAKVQLVQREFVYLRSADGDDDHFVIFDRVDSVKPEFKKFWLLQLRAKPEFDGNHRIAVGTEQGGIHLSEDTSIIQVTQEKAELFGKILLPQKDNRIVRRLGGWVTTKLRQPLKKDDNGPLDIEVESTQDLPDHPVVIITVQPSDPNKEVFDKFSVWPQMKHAYSEPLGQRVCYFCGGKTKAGSKPAKLLDCIRAIKSAPGFNMPIGARVIQEFRHMGIEGTDKGKESERINYPWGYGLGYNYGDGNQYGLWRIEVSPKKPSKFDNFLHVLHPALKGKGKLDAELIESVTGDIYGAKVGNKVVIFSKGPDSLAKGAYEVNGSGTVWQLMCNLKPEKKYQIRQDGNILFEKVTSKQGTIQFEATLNGKNSQFEFVEMK